MSTLSNAAYISHSGSIYCTSGPILAFILADLLMYDICHCQPFSTATQFRDAYLMSYKLAHEFPPNIQGERWSHCAGVVFWHGNDTCFTITPFPFSFGGVDLSTPAGEKWSFRTLPPPLRGRINERVAIRGGPEEEEGGTLCPNTGPRCKHNTCSSLEFPIVTWRTSHFSPSDTNLKSKSVNFHKILYISRMQLWWNCTCKSDDVTGNYLGVNKVKQSSFDSVFNCSRDTVQTQVALLYYLRENPHPHPPSQNKELSLKNNNTV